MRSAHPRPLHVLDRLAHWATFSGRCSKNALFEGIPEYCPVGDRRSCGQCAIGVLGRCLWNRSSWDEMELDGFGESQLRLPLDGQNETRSLALQGLAVPGRIAMRFFVGIDWASQNPRAHHLRR